MSAQHMPAADYDAAFEEGAQACESGALNPANPYDDWPGALRSGWRDGFAAAKAARDEWESDNHWRARNCFEAPGSAS